MADKNSLENLSPEERDELASLAQGLANNPETRPMYLRLIKKHSPTTAIPEIDVLNTVGNALQPHLAKIEKLEQEKLEREVNDRLRANRESLRDEGHSKEDIAAIEKMMVDEKIPSHATAAKYFKLQNQAAVPTTAHMRRAEVPIGRDKIKEAGGIRRWGTNEAHAAIDDIRAGRVKLH